MPLRKAAEFAEGSPFPSMKPVVVDMVKMPRALPEAVRLLDARAGAGARTPAFVQPATSLGNGFSGCLRGLMANGTNVAN